MSDFTSVFDEAGDSAEQAASLRAMATAKEASTDAAQYLFMAGSETEFDHRVALVEDTLFKAATNAGVSPQALVAEHRKGFGLVLEAKQSVVAAGDNHTVCPNHDDQSYNKSTGDCSCGSNHHRWADSNNPGGQKKSTAAGRRSLKASPCPDCMGARSVPASGHESFHEVHNGQVRCPTCVGHGVVHENDDQDADDRTSYERYGDSGDGMGDPGDAQDSYYGGDYLASLKTALAEGQDPLEWLEQEGAGEGQAEKPSEPGVDALHEAATRPFEREAFWGKTQAPTAPAAADPLAGRQTCPCGSRHTKDAGDGSGNQRCFSCDGTFNPKTGSLVNRPF